MEGFLETQFSFCLFASFERKSQKVVLIWLHYWITGPSSLLFEAYLSYESSFPSIISWSAGCFVGRSVSLSKKAKEATLPLIQCRSVGQSVCWSVCHNFLKRAISYTSMLQSEHLLFSFPSIGLQPRSSSQVHIRSTNLLIDAKNHFLRSIFRHIYLCMNDRLRSSG